VRCIRRALDRCPSESQRGSEICACKSLSDNIHPGVDASRHQRTRGALRRPDRPVRATVSAIPTLATTIRECARSHSHRVLTVVGLRADQRSRASGRYLSTRDGGPARTRHESRASTGGALPGGTCPLPWLPPQTTSSIPARPPNFALVCCLVHSRNLVEIFSIWLSSERLTRTIRTQLLRTGAGCTC